MKGDKLLGMKVIDKQGNDVGRIGNISIDEKTLSIKGFEIIERKGILAHDTEMIRPAQIDKIKDNMMLNIEKE